MQEIGLFKDFAFHGGTSLRILHRIDRFSEDLDLSLINPNNDYPFPEKMELLKSSLESSGFNFEFQNKSKPGNPIKKFYINDSSILNQFKDSIGSVIDGEKVKIKLELDVDPSEYQEFAIFKIQSPFSAEIFAHNLETCMGQKIHAVLCRAQVYGMDIVKGRDLYDLEWYLQKNIKPNLKNLSACLNRIGPWKDQKPQVNHDWIIKEVDACLKTKNFHTILSDVQPLIKQKSFKNIEQKWSFDYFSKNIREL
jgi:predicted nucleotidyltransferase component of viral defense system